MFDEGSLVSNKGKETEHKSNKLGNLFCILPPSSGGSEEYGKFY